MPTAGIWIDFFCGIVNMLGRGVHDIGVPTITAFLEFLQTLNLAASSIGRNLVAVRMFFRYLMLEGIVAESTVDLVSSPKLWERLPKVLSPDMVDALLAAPDGSVDRYYRRDRALLAVMYATGCRVSEVVNMKQQDIHLAENYCLCTGKGNKQRLVSLNPTASDAIQKYLEIERADLVSVAGKRSRLVVSDAKWTPGQSRNGLGSRSTLCQSRRLCSGSQPSHTSAQLCHSFTGWRG